MKNHIGSFGREVLNDGCVEIERVVRTQIYPIEITAVGTITHFGAYGQFKFIMNGEEFIGKSGQKYVKPANSRSTEYAGMTVTSEDNVFYWIDGITFEGTQPSGWRANYNSSNGYWNEVK